MSFAQVRDVLIVEIRNQLKLETTFTFQVTVMFGLRFLTFCAFFDFFDFLKIFDFSCFFVTF